MIQRPLITAAIIGTVILLLDWIFFSARPTFGSASILYGIVYLIARK